MFGEGGSPFALFLQLALQSRERHFWQLYCGALLLGEVTRIASTRDAAEAAARQCIRAFVVGERDGTAPELLSIPAEPVSGCVIYVRVDVMSSGPVNVMSSGPSEAVF